LGQLAIAGLSELMLGRSGPSDDFVSEMMSSARRSPKAEKFGPIYPWS
jgi:hypothetical protein